MMMLLQKYLFPIVYIYGERPRKECTTFIPKVGYPDNVTCMLPTINQPLIVQGTHNIWKYVQSTFDIEAVFSFCLPDSGLKSFLYSCVDFFSMCWLNKLKSFSSISRQVAIEKPILYIMVEFPDIWSIRKSFESLVGYISFPKGPTYSNLRLPIFNPLWDLISST